MAQKLVYFKSEDDYLSGKPERGTCLSLEGATIIVGKKDPSSAEYDRFTVNVLNVPSSKGVTSFEYICTSTLEQQQWVMGIRGVITRSSIPHKPTPSIKLQSRVPSRRQPKPPGNTTRKSSVHIQRRQTTAGGPPAAARKAVPQTTSSVHSSRTRSTISGNSGGNDSRPLISTRLSSKRGGDPSSKADEKKPWLLKGVSRVEAEQVLQESETNAFLVRESGKTKGAYALSVQFNGDVQHHLVSPPKEHSHVFSINGHATSCRSLAEMVDFLRITHGPPINWKTPLPRAHITNEGSKVGISSDVDGGEEATADEIPQKEVAVALGSYTPPSGKTGKLHLNAGDQMIVHLKDEGGQSVCVCARETACVRACLMVCNCF